MSFLGGIVGAIGNALGVKQQQDYNRSNMDHANGQNIFNYQHRYQWTMQDLKASGLNPILAATQGGLAGSVNGASALAGSASDIGGGFASGMSSSAQGKQAKTAEKTADSTIALNSSSAKKMEADAGLAASQTTQIDNNNKLFNATFDAQKAIYDQNLLNAQKQGQYLDEQTKGQVYNNTVLMPAMAAKAAAEGSYANSAAGYQSAQTAYSNEMTKGLAYTNTHQQKYGFTPTGSLTGNVLGVTSSALDRLGNFLKSRSHNKSNWRD